jgi:hypothetical protein
MPIIFAHNRIRAAKRAAAARERARAAPNEGAPTGALGRNLTSPLHRLPPPQMASQLNSRLGMPSGGSLGLQGLLWTARAKRQAVAAESTVATEIPVVPKHATTKAFLSEGCMPCHMHSRHFHL